MEALFTNVTLILAVISVLAFCVSVITQVIKNVGFLSKIPTDALVLVLSIGMILAAIMAGFIVAFISMFGWEKITELWKRTSKVDVDKLKNK